MKRKSVEDGKVQGPGIQSFKNAGKMPCKGSNVVVYEPTSKSSQLFEFQLNSAQIPQFGVHTGFLIEGAFQKQDGTAAWTACTIDNAANVVVAPNWFDFIIKDIDIFHVNSEISPDDVPTQAKPMHFFWLICARIPKESCVLNRVTLATAPLLLKRVGNKLQPLHGESMPSIYLEVP